MLASRRQQRSSRPSGLFVMVALVFTTTFTFFGCQMFSSPNTTDNLDIDHQPLDRRIGVLESLGGIRTTNQGTHLLKLDDGTTILLKSLAINLDDSKYSGKKIEVGGVLTYTTDNKQMMEVQNIDVLDVSLTEETQQTGWKDYTNITWGFGLKYREDFKMTEKDSLITFVRPVPEASSGGFTQPTSSSTQALAFVTEHVITVEAIHHESTITLLQYLNVKSDSSTDLLTAGFTKSKVGLYSNDAFKKTSSDGKLIEFYLAGPEKFSPFYHISYRGGTDNQNLEDQNIFYDVLASFRFLLPGEQMSAPIDIESVQEKDVLNNLLTQEKEPTQQSPKTTTEPTPPATQQPTISSTQQTTPSQQTQASETSSATQELVTGYSLFESPSFKFQIQYPKSWYFGSSETTDTDVIRHYDFGTKPVDEEPGFVGLDLVSGSIPSGSTVTAGAKTVTKVTTDNGIQIYVQGSGSRVYRLSGPSNTESTLLQMAATLED